MVVNRTTKIVEDWRQALDNNLYVASILMDLSKAFDCLPNDLLLTKLKAYDQSHSATDRSVLSSFAIDTIGKVTDLPLLYWIPKLHKDPYKQCFIAGSSSCSTKPLSKLLTSILTTIKDGLQKYCDIVYSRSGINQMWILKNSKQLLDNLHSNSIASVNSIKTFDFSTLYTTIPHDQLKSRLASIVNQAFCFKNGKKRYEYIVVKYNSTYFVKSHSDAKHKYTIDDIVRMINFLIDNIVVECGGEIFQQVICIPMGTYCAPIRLC